jgi:hypothetical protein
MTTFTNVPDSNLEPGDPIRSVDIIAIKENAVYNYENTTLEILDSQIFTSSGTWTKPTGFDPTDTVFLFLIGGGGSGGASRRDNNFSAAAGGSGAGFVCLYGQYSKISASVNFVLGAGGAAVTASANASAITGLNGGFSFFYESTLADTSNGYAARPGFGGTSTNSNVHVVVDATAGIPSHLSIFLDQNDINTLPKNTIIRSIEQSPYYTSSSSRVAASNGSSSGRLEFRKGFVSGGGSAARTNTADVPLWNPPVVSLFGIGGAGSGTANGTAGQNGGGGGGCCRSGASAVSGAGGNGALYAYVVRGKASILDFVGR